MADKNVTIKRWNISTWDVVYPKTIIANVANLSTTIADIYSDIEGKVADDDIRLTDARTPTAHSHTATDIDSGRFSIDRLPTGVAGTVLKGNGTNSPVWGTVAWDEINNKPTIDSANTASAIVARDASGNFSANTVTTNSIKIGNGEVEMVYDSGSDSVKFIWN